MGRSDPLRALVEWLEAAPAGTSIDARALAERLSPLVGRDPSPVEQSPPPTWREKVWLVPPETRLGVREVAEAIGRPRSWVYRRTGAKSRKAPLPHRLLDGELMFVAGELRRWIETHEVVVAAAGLCAQRQGKARAR